MKFYLKTNKPNIKSFQIIEGNLLYLNNKGLFVDDNQLTQEIENDYFTLYNNLPIYIQQGVTHIGEDSIEKSILVSSLNKDFAIFSSDLNLDDFTLRYELINIKDFSIVHDFNYLPVIKFVAWLKKDLLLYSGNLLSKYSLNDKDIIWELNQEISRIIGIWQNKVFIACNNHFLLSVDINSGQVVQTCQELKGFEAGQEYNGVLPEPSDFVLDKESGKLIGVFSKYYIEIDLESGEISYEDVQNELNQHGINSFRRMGDNPFTKDHLFVTAHAELEERPNVDLDCVLALNRNTKKVDWIHIFKDTGLGTNVPQITDTHLYQLDTEGTLHVFEKDP